MDIKVLEHVDNNGLELAGASGAPFPARCRRHWPGLPGRSAPARLDDRRLPCSSSSWPRREAWFRCPAGRAIGSAGGARECQVTANGTVGWESEGGSLWSQVGGRGSRAARGEGARSMYSPGGDRCGDELGEVPRRRLPARRDVGPGQDRAEVTRLGEGIRETGEIAPDAIRAIGGGDRGDGRRGPRLGCRRRDGRRHDGTPHRRQQPGVPRPGQATIAASRSR